MATLTETAYYARRAVIYGVVLIFAVIFLWFGFTSFSNYWRTTHPPPPPPPNVLFGKLPVLEFPKNQSKNLALSYKLETVTGSFPKMSDQAKVYFIPSIAGNLIGLDSATRQAQKMGFTAEPEKIDDRNYRFIDSDDPNRKLAIDIVSGNLNLVYDYRNVADFFSERDLPGKDQAIQEAKNLLESFDLLTADLETGKKSAIFLKLDENNNLSGVNSLIEAQFAKVFILRGNVNELPVYYSDPNKAPVMIIFSGSRGNKKRLVNLEYNYQVVDYENSATYPVITPDKAFENLKAGQGFVANFNSDKKDVVIREAIIGYYDSEKLQTYLQPIYVFLGDNNFIGYVSAISEEWFNK